MLERPDTEIQKGRGISDNTILRKKQVLLWNWKVAYFESVPTPAYCSS